MEAVKPSPHCGEPRKAEVVVVTTHPPNKAFVMGSCHTKPLWPPSLGNGWAVSKDVAFAFLIRRASSLFTLCSVLRHHHSRSR